MIGRRMHVRMAVTAAAVVLLAPAGGLPSSLAATQPPNAPNPSAPGAGQGSEEWAAQVEENMREELGTGFGGAWLTGAGSSDGSQALVIGVTDPADAAKVVAAGATPQVVTRGEATLNAIVATLVGNAGQAPSTVPGWYVDITTNSVVVLTSPGATAAAEAFVASSGVAAGEVRFVESSGQAQPLLDVIGGNGYASGTSGCSIGFSVVGGFVTAGHCGVAGTPTQNPSGTVQAANFPPPPSEDNDYAWVKVAPGNTPKGLVNNYQGGYIEVFGAREAPVGAPVCRYGATSGRQCGEVQAKNQSIFHPGYGWVHGLTRTSACGSPGDSGGPYLWGQQAQGVTSSAPGGIFCPGGETLYQPLREILGAYQLNLTLGGVWAGWTWLGGAITGRFSAVGMTTGGFPVHAFGRGTDARLYTTRFNGATWSTWQSLGGVLIGDPVAVARGGIIEVFAHGTDDGIWHRRWVNGQWLGWAGLGRPAVNVKVLGSPTAVSLGPNHVEVLVRGDDDALWTRRFDGIWRPWQPLGTAIVDDPVATTRGGNIEVIARGTDNRPYRKWFNGQTQTWQPWHGFPEGFMQGTAAVVSLQSSHLEVIVRRPDNNLWAVSGNPIAGFWNPWQQLTFGGTIGADPVAVVNGIRIDVITRATNGAIARLTKEAGSWLPTVPLGGAAAARPPGVVRQPGGPVHVFVASMAGQTPYTRAY